MKKTDRVKAEDPKGREDHRPIVILLPDFGGSRLLSAAPVGEAKKRQRVWPAIHELAKGGFVRSLEIRPDSPREPLPADGLIDLYDPLRERLDKAYQVIPFACDFRLSIEAQAKELASLLGGPTLAGRPLDFVAHGMGGLVALWHIHTRQAEWTARLEPGKPGGRLVMLGAPLGGCFDAVAALAGTSLLPRWLNAIDLENGQEAITRALRSFPALYDLLPAPGEDAAIHSLYSGTAWHEKGISAAELDRAARYRRELARAASAGGRSPDASHAASAGGRSSDALPLDPARMVCITGTGTPTRSSLEVLPDGPLQFGITTAGDGVVPQSRAMLSSVPAYEVAVSHADLLSNEGVLGAVAAFLAGEPIELRRAEAGRRESAISVHSSHLGVQRLDARIERLAKETFLPAKITDIPPEEPAADDDEALAARITRRLTTEATLERALLQGIFGQTKDMLQLLAEADQEKTSPFRLQLQPVCGDLLKDSTAPVLLVGHYTDERPTGSEAALDQGLGYWISDAVDQGFVGGRPGETFYIPMAPKGAPKARSVLLVSKGPAGQLGPDDLKGLVARATYCLLSLHKHEVATVVMGTGRDELPFHIALSALLEGLREGIHRYLRTRVERRRSADIAPEDEGQPREEPSTSSVAQPASLRVQIVERYPASFDRLNRALEDLKERHANARRSSSSTGRLNGDVPSAADEGGRAQGGVHMDVLPPPSAAPPEARGDSPAPEEPDRPLPAVRLTVEHRSTGAMDILRYSALTRTASIPVRDVEADGRMTKKLITSVTQAIQSGDAEHLGRVLGDYLLPRDFHRALVDAVPLTILLDHAMAAVPWEMLVLDGSLGPVSFGIDLELTRQLRAHISPAPGEPRPRTDHLRFLVIADPAPDMPLPGAQEEGRRIVEMLREKAPTGRGQDGAESTGARLLRTARRAPSSYGAQSVGTASPSGGRADAVGRPRIEVVAAIGPDECDPAELLALLLEESFDVIHFTGHGRFDATRRERSGWILRDGMTLSPSDLSKAHHVPRLVFANACSTAVMDRVEPRTGSRGASSVAEELFRHGVETFIGAGWPIDDTAAADFALVFYKEVLAGATLGESMKAAREECRKNAGGTTWGAFQHYGWHETRLVEAEPSLWLRDKGGRSVRTPSQSGGPSVGTPSQSGGRARAPAPNRKGERP